MRFKLNRFIQFVVVFAIISACQRPEESPSELDVFQTRNITQFNLRHSSVIALTFDDGPSKNTERLLNSLKMMNVKATFFVIGNNAVKRPDLLQRMKDEGHVLANHTRNHPNLRKKSSAAAFNEIMYTHNAIKDYLRSDERLYFRAPYGAWSERHVAQLNADEELGNYIGPIFWDIGGETKFSHGRIVSAADWECWSRKRSVRTCSKGYLNEIRRRGGGVSLMHDLKIQTIEMVETIVPILQQEGYSFVTLDELEALDQYEMYTPVVDAGDAANEHDIFVDYSDKHYADIEGEGSSDAASDDDELVIYN